MVSFIISVTIDTTGLEKKLHQLVLAMPGVMKSIVDDSIDIVDKNSMMLLNQDITWGHSVNPDERIANSKEVEYPLVTPTRIVGTLKYTSPHAMISNYGGITQRTITKDEGAFPIGLQQGKGIVFSPTFELQPGKFWFDRGIQMSLDEVYTNAQNRVNQLIASL
jgi:hypothetical protein